MDPIISQEAGVLSGEFLSYISAKAWLDNNCSFTTNEVAINWNAPAAFLAGGLEAIFNTSEFDLKDLYEKKYQIPLPRSHRFSGFRDVDLTKH